tara:strand:- start:209 stop:907 length:699 start_codon:yes stop_codon:yes gene_type:complete
MFNFGSSMKCFGFGKLTASLCSVLLFGALAGTSHAAPIGAPGDLTPGNNVITFEEFALGTVGPITFGGVTISASSANPSHGQVRQSFGAFVQHPGILENQFFGFNSPTYSIHFNGGFVQEFGLGVFDPNFDNNHLIAYDYYGNELERVTSAAGDPLFPTGPLGGNFSTFVGFKRNTADIYRVDLVSLPGDLLGLDTVTYSNVQVPEPAAGLVLLGGLAALGFWRRQRNLKTA